MFEMQCEKVEEFIYNDEIKYYKFKNFKNVKGSNSPHIFKGKYLVITTDDQLWHTLSEQIIQYDLLIKKIPDLKLFIINVHPPVQEPVLTINKFCDLANERGPYKSLAFFRDMMSAYIGKDNLNTQCVYSADNSDFMLEECYFICDTRSLIDPIQYKKDNVYPYWAYEIEKRSDGTIQFGHMPWSGQPEEKSIWSMYGLREARERFRSYLKKDLSLPSKIYIDRSDANKKWQDKPDVFSIKTKKQWSQIRSFKDEKKIRKYFIDLGYVPIIMSEYEYLDQLNFYYNATHIAGLSGTGLLNAFVCEEKTHIIEIMVSEEFIISYQYLNTIAPVKVLTIDLKTNPNEEAKIDINAFKKLNKHKVFFI